MYPNFVEEKKLWKRGLKRVVGLDEAGRGPLAGPVTAGAVLVRNWKAEVRNLREVKDSKQLSPKMREKLYTLITRSQNIQWGIGIVSEKAIDKINILEATKLAMAKAVVDLSAKMIEVRPPSTRPPSILPTSKMIEVGPQSSQVWSLPIDYLILDGNFKINSSIPQKSIIKGDEKVFSCAAASIIAKVTRDRMMVRYHKKYPRYGFDQHKGYPTALHRARCLQYGLCPIHRKSFTI